MRGRSKRHALNLRRWIPFFGQSAEDLSLWASIWLGRAPRTLLGSTSEQRAEQSGEIVYETLRGGQIEPLGGCDWP